MAPHTNFWTRIKKASSLFGFVLTLAGLVRIFLLAEPTFHSALHISEAVDQIRTDLDTIRPVIRSVPGLYDSIRTLNKRSDALAARQDSLAIENRRLTGFLTKRDQSTNNVRDITKAYSGNEFH